MTLEMEAPVERVCFLPGGAAIAACAGNEVCVWDVISGGTRLFSTKSHQKTITDVCAVSLPEATGAVAGVRVVTGGLDGYVKVHEMDQFQVTHSIKYPGEWCAGRPRVRLGTV